MCKGAMDVIFTDSSAIILLSFVVLCLYGYYYYRQCIKRARELIKIYLGEVKYQRLRK